MDREQRLARLDRMANTLDTRFRLPVIGIPVGWDSILGLIPGFGDLVTVGPGVWMIVEGHRLGARKRTVARMALNTGIDATLGSIPVIGDAFDLVFKSHRRNIALLRADVAGKDAQSQEDSAWQTANAQATGPERPTHSTPQTTHRTTPDARAVRSSATSPRGMN